MACGSGCGCLGGLCDQSPGVLMGDPLAIKVAAAAGGSVAPTMAGLLPTVVWPSDVDAKKRQIDPSMQATNAAVIACAALDPATKKAWGDFFAAWVSFRDEGGCVFGCANKYDEANAFAKQLAAWQDSIRPKCSVPGPPPIPPDELNETSIGAIKWAAAAVIAVAVVYGVHTVMR